MNQRITSILLLLCLAMPFAVTSLFLNLRQVQVRSAVKHQIMRGLDRDQLVVLAFSDEDQASQLRWEHEGEFEFQGRMYDVVESERKGDSTWFWCWADDEETHLNRQVRELTALAMGQNPQNRESQSRLVDFCKSLYFAPARPWQTEPAVSLTGPAECFSFLVPPCLSPPTPPPRLV